MMFGTISLTWDRKLTDVFVVLVIMEKSFIYIEHEITSSEV